MHLVEIEAGREQHYETLAALAAAIRSSEIGPQSRIFHRASSSWVSITAHPEFRKAVAERASEPLPPLARTSWTFFGGEATARETETPPVSADAGAPSGTTPAQVGLRGLLGRALRGLSSNRSPETSSS
jgi:hypothetical protein